MSVYFNDHEPYVCAWLRNLYPDARVDERSIVDLEPGDLAGYQRVHLFAGIGGWEYALELAGWPEDESVWSGSCPCQPFSAAGRADGVLDARHLWPAFHRLIAECRPPVVFGEQVASRAGRHWLAGVRDDLERLGYAVGAADLPAASVGAPHIRQRLFWVAESTGHGSQRIEPAGTTEGTAIRDGGGLADAEGHGCGQGRADEVWSGERTGAQGAGLGPPDDCECGGLGHSDESRREAQLLQSIGTEARPRESPTASPWADAEWLACRDGKARRTQSGLCPVADGIPGRVGRLRAYGNAIVPQVAAEFIRVYRTVRENP